MKEREARRVIDAPLYRHPRFNRSLPIPVSSHTRDLWLIGLCLAALNTGCATSPPSGASNTASDSSAVTGSATPSPQPAALSPTSWRLTSISGSAVVNDAEPTLEFLEPRKSTGSGSCNRFIAPVTISGDSIAFGAIGSTRMMCPEPIATQETKYFEALRRGGRFTVNGDTLLVFSAGTSESLRFLRVSPGVPQ